MYTDPVQVHEEEIVDVERYIERHGHEDLTEKEAEYQTFMRLLAPYKKVDSTTLVLEIGTGTGWFPLLCKQHGVPCKGLEISPQLVDHAKELGQRTGLLQQAATKRSTRTHAPYAQGGDGSTAR